MHHRLFIGLRLGAVACVTALACSGSSPPKDASSASKPDGSAGTTDASADGPMAGDAAADGGVKPLDWVGVVGTGQSLSVGAMGTPITATTQPFHNLALSLGTSNRMPPFDPTNSALTMVPLREPIRSVAVAYPSAYPSNLNGETPHTAMGSQITAMFQAANPGGDYVTVHTVVGESGQPMSVIDKTAVEIDDAGTSQGRAYAATLFEAAAIQRLAAAANKTYGIGAIVLTHGESDAGNTAYEAALVQLWSDYNKDLSAITGQTTSIPLIVSQQHSVPQGMGYTSPSTIAPWRAGVDHHGDIVCSGPKYQYPYSTVDNVHLTTHGYELLGEKYGEIFYQKVVLGQDWQPLQPTAATRAGSVLTVTFHVPNPPLAWDDTMPSPHPTGYPQWTDGRGFEVTLNGTPVTIQSVVIADDTVQITCGSDLTTGGVLVSYAYTSDGAPMPGGTARWGHLRDSDAVVGATTQLAQPNYCVSFTMQVP